MSSCVDLGRRRALALLATGLAVSACSGNAAAPASSAAAAAALPSTAGPGVSLLAAPLEMPGLDRRRQVRIYLPPGYATSGKRYPVLYMHDGQNLFDDASAYAGEWQVDETLDALARAGQLELIVVGIDNGGTLRMSEMNPAQEGPAYLDFIVKVVKPLVDSSYRTLPERASTGIMGSSMGGLISHEAIARYPQVFGKAGIFSPSYWAAAGSVDSIVARPLPPDARLYLLMGDREGGQMLGDVQRMASALRAAGHPDQALVLDIVPGGEHGERLWAGALRRALLWLFAPAP